MGESRLLQPFTLAAPNNVLRVLSSTYGTFDVTLTPGTYRHTPTFLAMLKTRLEADIAGSTWTIEIAGVTTIAGVGSGRIRYTIDAGTFSFLFDHANTTIDAGTGIGTGVLGWPLAYNSAPAASTASVLISDWVHRRGYYPQTDPVDERPIRKRFVVTAEESNRGDIDSDHVRTYNHLDVMFEFVSKGLDVLDNADVAAIMAGVNLNTDDGHAAFEIFAQDLIENGNDFRFYADITDTAAFSGEYKFPHNSPMWGDPLALSVPQPAAGGYAIRIHGNEIP